METSVGFRIYVRLVLAGISKLSGQAKAATYPQPEGVLGECMVSFGRKLDDDEPFGKSTLSL